MSFNGEHCFFLGPDGDYVVGGVQAGALRMLNAIPEICKRSPGLVSTLDLPCTPTTNISRKQGKAWRAGGDGPAFAMSVRVAVGG